MKVALLQMEIALAAPLENQREVERLFRLAMQQQPDVIVLPELWNIGFFPAEPAVYADRTGEQTQKLLSRLAKCYAVNIVGGSVASKEADGLYNVSYIVDRQGRIINAYRKIHLFSPAGENEKFRSGTELCTFMLDGVKAAVVICYDLRFCELIRLLALQEIAVLFIPAAWPHPRLKHWQTLLQARAIENQIFVVAVNGAGTANQLDFCGHSMVIDPWGEVLSEAGDTTELIYGELDFGIVREIRQRIHVFRDRQTAVYSLQLPEKNQSIRDKGRT